MLLVDKLECFSLGNIRVDTTTILIKTLLIPLINTTFIFITVISKVIDKLCHYN